MGVTVRNPGLLTTIQDLGRRGWQKHGVVVGGAMDPLALRIANLLVGNAETEGGLEMTLLGPKLHFAEDALIAITGGDLQARIAGVAVPRFRPVFVPKDSVLEWHAAISGCRAYLAVAGGFAVPEVLGSKSTYLRAGLGGLDGRALQKEDVLPLQAPSARSLLLLHQLKKAAAENGLPFAAADWAVSRDLLPAPDAVNAAQASGATRTVRVICGGQWAAFSDAAKERFFNDAFQVTPQSDRMGYRLQGPKLELRERLELISEAVTAGTVQVPPEGQPIVLLADRQTTGGYPKIAQVAAVDLPLIAQVKPGESVRFQEISLAEAQALYLQREWDICLFKKGLQLQMAGH